MSKQSSRQVAGARIKVARPTAEMMMDGQPTMFSNDASGAVAPPRTDGGATTMRENAPAGTPAAIAADGIGDGERDGTAAQDEPTVAKIAENGAENAPEASAAASESVESEPAGPADTAQEIGGADLRVTVGERFLVPVGALSIASGNFWSTDTSDKDEAYRRIEVHAKTPAGLDPLLVLLRSNGWAIVGDPAGYLAVKHVHADSPALDAIELPATELTGSAAAITLHIARVGLGGRPVRNMRRARLALQLCETQGLSRATVAGVLGVHGSGATRDLKAARMEREYPALARILIAPSDAPTSYYTDLREYADGQPAPEKALAGIVAAAGRLAKAGKLFSPKDARAALGVLKPLKDTSAPKPAIGVRRALTSTGPAQGAVLEQAGRALTLTLTFPANGTAFEERANRIER